MIFEPVRKLRAGRNRTLELTAAELQDYPLQLVQLQGVAKVSEIQNRILHQDVFTILDWLPDQFVDLLFLDPPYNLTKSFNQFQFKEQSSQGYQDWLMSWLPKMMRLLKPTASVYICGDWRSSTAIQQVAEQYLQVRNRITWEREKGRGSKSNWKNCSEDIWFCTVSSHYTFNVEAVKLKRRVHAPYTDATGQPKDWEQTKAGKYRQTHPSNLWTDLTIPFWSMPENTPHPTQKPEKLLAKIILASSNPGEIVFDPFLGSGTAIAVAQKLGRSFVGVEQDLTYCCWAAKRVELAKSSPVIQGYREGIFWDRNLLQ